MSVFVFKLYSVWERCWIERDRNQNHKHFDYTLCTSESVWESMEDEKMENIEWDKKKTWENIGSTDIGSHIDWTEVYSRHVLIYVL